MKIIFAVFASSLAGPGKYSGVVPNAVCEGIETNQHRWPDLNATIEIF